MQQTKDLVSEEEEESSSKVRENCDCWLVSGSPKVLGFKSDELARVRGRLDVGSAGGRLLSIEELSLRLSVLFEPIQRYFERNDPFF